MEERRKGVICVCPSQNVSLVRQEKKNRSLTRTRGRSTERKIDRGEKKEGDKILSHREQRVCFATKKKVLEKNGTTLSEDSRTNDFVPRGFVPIIFFSYHNTNEYIINVYVCSVVRWG